MPEIVLGILIALFIYESTGYSPGGIITAGYLALYYQHWQFVAATVVVAFLAWGVVRQLSSHMVLYGKRLFCVYLLTGLLLSQGLALFFGTAGYGLEFATIGYLLPGLIAKDFDHQGIMPTTGALFLAMGLTKTTVFAGAGWLW